MIPNLDMADPAVQDIDHIDETTHIAHVLMTDGSVKEYPAIPQGGPAADLTIAEQDHLLTKLAQIAPSPGDNHPQSQQGTTARLAALEAQIAQLRREVVAQEAVAAKHQALTDKQQPN